MSNGNPEPVERRTGYAMQHEAAEQRTDPQTIIEGVAAVGVLLTGVAAVKEAFGDNGAEQSPPPPQPPPPVAPPPAEPQAGRPSE